MNIAYLISAYKDPLNLYRLVTALTEEWTYFFIHIDKNVNMDPFIKILSSRNNIFFIKRYPINWAGFNQVNYQIELLKAAVCCNTKFDRYVCLTGQDYPISSNLKIKKYFQENEHKEFICGVNISNLKEEKWKIIYYHFNSSLLRKGYIKVYNSILRIQGLLNIKKNNYLKIQNTKWDIYWGSDYWALTHKCVEIVLNTYNTIPRIKKYFQYSFAPSELCIHTIIFNSTIKNNAIYLKLDYTEPFYLRFQKCTPLHYVYYDHCIKIMDLKDFNSIIKSPYPFFRKSETGISDDLIKEIDKYRTI